MTEKCFKFPGFWDGSEEGMLFQRKLFDLKKKRCEKRFILMAVVLKWAS